MTGAEHDHKQLERLTFFSDAVFAIAITLLVIEIHPPKLTLVTESSLADALLKLVPQYVGFLVSFFVIGRFWVGHHRAFGYLVRVDERLVWRNLLLLLTIAFMPFPTALVSQYTGTRVGVGIYAAWLLLAGLLNLWLIRHAMAGPLVGTHVPEAQKRLARRTPWSPIVVALLALGAAMIRPEFALVPLLAAPLVVALFVRDWGRGEPAA